MQLHGFIGDATGNQYDGDLNTIYQRLSQRASSSVQLVGLSADESVCALQGGYKRMGAAMCGWQLCAAPGAHAL